MLHQAPPQHLRVLLVPAPQRESEHPVPFFLLLNLLFPPPPLPFSLLPLSYACSSPTIGWDPLSCARESADLQWAHSAAVAAAASGVHIEWNSATTDAMPGVQAPPLDLLANYTSMVLAAFIHAGLPSALVSLSSGDDPKLAALSAPLLCEV